MNYLKLYNSIIENSKTNTRSKSNSYFELHHINPRCLGGTDESDNLTLLTAKEHFVAHHLLTKIYPDSTKLHSAFWMMLICISDNQQRYKTTGKSFQVAKEKQAQIKSEYWKSNNPNKTNPKSGKNNPMYGIHRFGELNPFFGKTHTDKTIEKIKQTKANNPKQWSIEEKQKLKDSWKNRPIITCPHCNKESIHASNMRRYHFDNCKFKIQE